MTRGFFVSDFSTCFSDFHEKLLDSAIRPLMADRTSKPSTDSAKKRAKLTKPASPQSIRAAGMPIKTLLERIAISTDEARRFTPKPRSDAQNHAAASRIRYAP